MGDPILSTSFIKMINPAAISAGIAAASEVYKQGKNLYDTIRPKKQRPKQAAVQRRPRAQNRVQNVRVSRQLAPVAYSVAGNSAFGGSVGRRTIVRDEFVGTYSSTGTAYNFTRFHVQPGDSSSFPWLSGACDAYALYRFKKLKYRTVPSAASSQAGRVILGIEYEGTGLLDTLASINNAAGARSASVWAEVDVSLDPDAMFPFGKYKKIQSGTVADQENSDAAHLYVAFDGVASGVSVSLYVQYEVELFMPKIGGTTSVVNSHSILPLSQTQIATSTTSPVVEPLEPATNPFGVIENVANRNYILPKGTWEIECSFTLRILSGAATNSYPWELTIAEWDGVSNVPLTTFQNAALRWQSKTSTYFITGTERYYNFYEKLLYISDGVTPMCVNIISGSASNMYTHPQSFLMVSPIL